MINEGVTVLAVKEFFTSVEEIEFVQVNEGMLARILVEEKSKARLEDSPISLFVPKDSNYFEGGIFSPILGSACGSKSEGYEVIVYPAAIALSLLGTARDTIRHELGHIKRGHCDREASGKRRGLLRRFSEEVSARFYASTGI